MCGLRTRLRTDVNPPRFLVPSNCHRRGLNHRLAPSPIYTRYRPLGAISCVYRPVCYYCLFIAATYLFRWTQVIFLCNISYWRKSTSSNDWICCFSLDAFDGCRETRVSLSVNNVGRRRVHDPTYVGRQCCLGLNCGGGGDACCRYIYCSNSMSSTASRAFADVVWTVPAAQQRAACVATHVRKQLASSRNDRWPCSSVGSRRRRRYNPLSPSDSRIV